MKHDGLRVNMQDFMRGNRHNTDIENMGVKNKLLLSLFYRSSSKTIVLAYKVEQRSICIIDDIVRRHDHRRHRRW
jgi:hypothetical protein